MKQNFRVLRIVSIVLIAVFIPLVAALQITRCVKSNRASLIETASMVSGRVEVNNWLNSYVGAFKEDAYQFYTKIAVRLIGDKYSDDALDAINEKWSSLGEYEFVYVDRDGNLHCTEGDGQENLKLSADEIESLKNGQDIEHDGLYLCPFACAGGQLVSVMDIPEDVDYVSIDEACANGRNSVYIYDSNSNKVLYSSLPGLIISQKDFLQIAGNAYWGIDEPNTMSGFLADMTSSQKSPNIIMNLYYCYVDMSREGLMIVTFTPMVSMLTDVLVNTIVIMIAMIIFFIIAGKCIREISVDDGCLAEGRYIKLPFKRYINTALFKKITIAIVLPGVILSAVMLYSLMVINYSKTYSTSYKSLENVENSIESMSNSSEIITKEWKDYENYRLNTLDYLIASYSPLTEQNELDEIRKDLGAYEFTIYDGNGIITASSCDPDHFNMLSTRGYVGYKITDDNEDAEYKLWDLLKSADTFLFFEADDGSGDYYCAVRRECTSGIIMERLQKQELRDYLDKYGSSDAVLTSDYSGEMYFSNDGNTEFIKYADKANDRIVSVANPFDESVFKNDNLSIAALSGGIYSLLTRQNEKETLINAVPFGETFDVQAVSIRLAIYFFAIVSIIVILGKCVFKRQDIEVYLVGEHKKNNPIDEDAADVDTDGNVLGQFVDKSTPVQGILKFAVISSAFYMVSTFLMDYFTSGESILKILFSGQWEKKFNMFSFTVILLLTIRLIIVWFLAKKITKVISDSVDVRPSSIIQLASSLCLALFTIWTIATALSNVGVDTKTLIAGIGVSGVALGIGAKDTINDLIAGLFIILDGHVRIGDYVEVGGFYGKVIKMNIKTTKIQNYESIKSINNSNVTNVVNYSKTPSSVKILVTVPNDTDLEVISRILEDNSERLNETAKNRLKSKLRIFDGDVIQGKGIQLTLLASVDEQYKLSCIRMLKREIFLVFEDNNIEVLGIQ